MKNLKKKTEVLMLKIFYSLLLVFIASCSSAQSFNVGTGVKVKWGEIWYEGKIIEVKGDKFKIHYDGYGSSYDDWRTKEEMVLLESAQRNNDVSTAPIPARESPNNTQTHATDGLTGKLYLRTTFFGTSLSISTIFLSNNGIIVRDAKNGVDPLDLEKEKLENSANTGTYVINGDRMNITWNNGKTTSWRMEHENNVLSGLDGGIVTLQPKMPAGYKLNGRFAAMGVTVNASSSQTYIFKDDGTFSLSGTAAVFNTEETAQASSNKNGNYSISGNTLTLRFNNGQTTRSVIAINNIGGKQHLIINRASYPQE